MKTYKIIFVLFVVAAMLRAWFGFVHSQSQYQQSSRFISAHPWPKEIRQFGNSTSQIRLPPGVNWIRTSTSSEIAPAFEVYVTGVKGRVRVDTPLGGNVGKLGEPKTLRFFLKNSLIKWKPQNITTAHFATTIEVKGDAWDFKHSLKHVILPALVNELRLVRSVNRGNSIDVYLEMQTRLKGELFDGEGQLEAIVSFPTARFKADRLNAREWRLTLPKSVAGSTAMVRFEQESNEAAFIKLSLVKKGSKVDVKEVDSSLARSRFVTLPDYSRWQKIGPHLPADFKPSAPDPHSSGGVVYTTQEAIAHYRRDGTFPLGTTIVKESQPLSVYVDNQVKRRITLLEVTQLVADKQDSRGLPNWVYGATILEKRLDTGEKIYELPSPNCFSCHQQFGHQNVFVDRYPVLRKTD